MVELTKGRGKSCKDSRGGVDKVYLFSFVKYSRSQNVHSDLDLTSFPATTIYEFEPSNQPNFLNDSKEDEGGKYYTEDISFDFVGIFVYDEFEKFLNNDVRCIIKDRNGKYRLLGAFNGLTCERISRILGSNKGSFRGYKIPLTGQEELPALFINDLNGAGFTISEDNFLILENDPEILTEENEFIILE